MENSKEDIEEKREKVFRIISKDYEYLDEGLSVKEVENIEKEINIEVDKSLLTGKIKLFYTTTDDNLDFETVYNLKEEKLEVYIDNNLKESCNLKLDEMCRISSNPADEFHLDYTEQTFSSDLEIENTQNIEEKNIEIDSWAKRIEEFKSKEKSFENEIMEDN